MKCLQQTDGRVMVQQHKIIFFAAELTRLLQNEFRDTDLADVVEQGSNFQLPPLIVVPTQQARHSTGNRRDPLSVQKARRVQQLHRSQQQRHQTAGNNLFLAGHRLLTASILRQREHPNQDTAGVCRHRRRQSVRRQS